MRKAVLAIMAAMMLSGCVSMFDELYDEQARRECDREHSSDRSCYDRVEQQRRENNRRYGN